MKKEIVPLSIAPPSGPGLPAILECESFGGHIHRFDEALELTFATEFTGATLDKLGKEAKADSGFERYFCGSVAIGYSQGFKAGKAAAYVESLAATTRAATVAAASVVKKTFSELVTDQVKAGKSKSESVRFCIANHPREYALARVIGIPSL